MRIDFRPGLRGFAAVGALALLAACEPSAKGTAPEASAAAAPTQSAAAAPSGEERIQMTECPTPSGGRVHFRIAERELRVPATAIRDAIPANLGGPLRKEAVKEALKARIAQGQGCPGTPLDAVLLLVKDDLGHPLLEGSIGLLRSPDGDVTGPFAELTGQLQRQPNQNCRPMSGDLLACVGTETRGERQTEVMYVISTDTRYRMNSGGPLAARCVLQEAQIVGCNLVDEVGGNITFDATLNAGEYTTEGLKGARDAALAKIRSFSL